MKRINLIVTFILLLVCSCTPVAVKPTTNTLEANLPLPTSAPYTISEVESLAGLDVQEPTYLPENVFFDYATYENQSVTLYFNFGERGRFFQITQTLQEDAIPNPTACGVSGDECETIKVGDIDVNYRLTAPTETLTWESNDFSFQLFRMAGEPDKIYKDELIKIIASML